MPRRLAQLAKRLVTPPVRLLYQRVDGSRWFGPLLLTAAVRQLERRFRVLMPAEEVAELAEAMATARVPAWVMGGWGIDAVVGRETRPHADLDLLVADSDETRALAVLGQRGYETVKRRPVEMLPLHTAIVLRDPGDRRVDLLPIDLAELERLVDEHDGSGGPYVAGTVDGRPVACLSTAAQELLHAGYLKRARDYADLALLRLGDSQEQRNAKARYGFRRRILPAARRRLRATLGVGPSALNVHVQELEGVAIAPHITLLNPFVPAARIGPELIRELEEILAGVPAFDITFARTGRFPGILYIAPEPAAPLVALVEALAARWPEFPPYEGAFDTIIPHLTVAHGRGALVLPGAVAERLPLRVRVTHVDLMVMGRSGRWTMRASLPTGG